MRDDRMPTVGAHRGVPIHDFQPVERIEGVVKPAIDDVFAMTDPAALVSYTLDAANPPEARLFALARCEAAWQMAAESRVNRSAGIDLVKLHAATAGLGSLRWIDPNRYTTMLERNNKRAVMREEPLTTEQIGL